jgi:DNA/RNA-binding domain of Phe-tRNA-synthetase-like protein
MNIPTFQVSEEVRQLAIKSRGLVVSGVKIPGTYPPQLETEIVEREGAIRSSTSLDDLKHETYLKSFRDVHRAVGNSARSEIAAPEALLRLLHRHGRLPRINPLVDIYNLVSAETRLALGAHDLSRIAGGVALRITDGAEKFVPLGAAAPTIMPAGEYAYVDEDEVICRLEVRQCDKSKVVTTTTDCLFFLHGSPLHPLETLDDARASLWDLVQRYCAASSMTVLADE